MQALIGADAPWWSKIMVRFDSLLMSDEAVMMATSQLFKYV